ncbi:MAG: hypothetical protein IT340_00875 [Chloroflexi bacterium]|nr:hypothetical protein [Chloroflexota bacterium]
MLRVRLVATLAIVFGVLLSWPAAVGAAAPVNGFARLYPVPEAAGDHGTVTVTRDARTAKPRLVFRLTGFVPNSQHHWRLHRADGTTVYQPARWAPLKANWRGEISAWISVPVAAPYDSLPYQISVYQASLTAPNGPGAVIACGGIIVAGSGPGEPCDGGGGGSHWW